MDGVQYIMGFSVGLPHKLHFQCTNTSILGKWNLCLCVGTLITEWEAGKQMCAEFLKSEVEWRVLADQLVAIAVHYGFDGWLINIENALQVWPTVVWVTACRIYFSSLNMNEH